MILGGGRREFLPNNTVDEENSRGLRWDNRNLIKEWQDLREDNGDAYEYVWNKEQLLNVDPETNYLMGLFEGSHCRYNLEANHDLEPTLTEMVEAAIKILSKNEDGYFVFVEGKCFFIMTKFIVFLCMNTYTKSISYFLEFLFFYMINLKKSIIFQVDELIMLIMILEPN